MAPSLIVEEAGLGGPLLPPPGALAALALPPRRRPVQLPLLTRLTLQVAVDLRRERGNSDISIKSLKIN